eukprot:gene20099-20641_t
MLSTFYEHEKENGTNIAAAYNCTFQGRATYNPNAKGITIKEIDVLNAVTNNIANGNLNKGVPDPNGIYTVIFRGDFSWEKDSGEFDWNTGSKTADCGYHTVYPYNNVILKIAVVGTPSWDGAIRGSGLNNGCITLLKQTPNGNLGADNLMTTYAHELAECITDYDNDGWYVDGGMETADLCNMVFGTNGTSNIQVGSKQFLIQELFLPGIGCRMSLESVAPTVASTSAPMKNGISPGSDDQNTAVPNTLPTISPGFLTDISYHEGWVLGTQGSIPLRNIFLGNLSSSTMELMNYFAANIGNTSWFRILQSYFEIDFYGHQISIDAQTSFNGNISLFPSAQKLTLTDLDFVKLILSLQNDPVFVSTDTTCVYTIMFRGDFNVSVNGKSWLTDWCSYHGAF